MLWPTVHRLDYGLKKKQTITQSFNQTVTQTNKQTSNKQKFEIKRSGFACRAKENTRLAYISNIKNKKSYNRSCEFACKSNKYLGKYISSDN